MNFDVCTPNRCTSYLDGSNTQHSRHVNEGIATAAEPALVMLDGSASTALAQSRDNLTVEEYNHILQVQAELAELDLEEECKRASSLRPRKLKEFSDHQPTSTIKQSRIVQGCPSGSKDAVTKTTDVEHVHTPATDNVVRIDEELSLTQVVKAPMHASLLIEQRTPSKQMQASSDRSDVLASTPYAQLFGFTPPKASA